ncbi:MAG: Na(+)/H(+) antiporter subunit D [Dehalococcoidaceae bacterium]|nr:Na(+)/H(+) antiporter subunit D [Dehalococcoidaceae bacterium]
MMLTEIVNSIPPALIFLAGAALLPLCSVRLRPLVFVALPVLTLLMIINLEPGTAAGITFMNLELVVLRVDSLSLAFGYVFCLISFFGGWYAWHLKEKGQQVAALIYAGSALGAVFAGDLFTLFVFWEMMLVGSAYLVWAGRTRFSAGAGMRYIIVHLAGGSFLLAGILWQFAQTGSIEFAHLQGASSYLILIGFAVNAAIPPLHAWLPDAYPESSVTGSVFLSAFTTKVAIYTLIRGFEGLDILIWAGAVMAVYGAVYAFMQNDIRRVLAYGIISQLGFMVAAVGIGTPMAINGAVAHAFSHILYKGLLFMSAGAVLFATGRSKLTELGGLARSMPAVFVLYMIGAVSISGFPLFSGFVSKSMEIYAAEAGHYTFVFLMLQVASAGTFLYTGLKLPYFIFFGEDKLVPIKPIPRGMYAGMGLAALSCIVIGIFPQTLYSLLPFQLDYQPYTVAHLWETTSLLIFTGLVFRLMLEKIKPKPAIILDTDWFYRRPAGLAYRMFVETPARVFTRVNDAVMQLVDWISGIAANPVGFMVYRTGKLKNRTHKAAPPAAEPAIFDPDRYRGSLGTMVLIVMAGFIIIGLISFVSS